VAEDITDTRRSEEEHRAHRVILELATSQSPLEKIFEALATSLEVIFPTTLCYIIKKDERGDGFTTYPRATQPWLGPLFSRTAALDRNNILARALSESREVIVPDVSAEPSSVLRDRLLSTGIKSFWIKPITLSNKAVWGACVLNHRVISLAPSDVEREHLDLLVRLVATVIERITYHEQLTSTSERLECAERAGKIGVFDWNPLSGAIVWTQQMEELFGLAAGTFQGTFAHWRNLIHPADVQRVIDTLKGLVGRRGPWFKTSYRFLRKNGDCGWMEVQGAITYDSSGSPIRGVGVATDITERTLVEDRARRDQERLSLALEAGGLGFWDWHIPSGDVQFGGSWATMLGYTLDEIQPTLGSWTRLVHPDDLPEANAALERHFRRESPIYECEHRLRKKDGSWTWVLDRGRVVEWDESGKPVRAIGIHSDITEQRSAREALKTAATRKDEFLATLAHELRNPLAPIRTGLQIIRRDPSGEQAARAREMMERQLNHMVRLVDDLLDVSRITRGEMELRKEEIAIEDVLSLAVENSRPAIDSGGQVFHREILDKAVTVHGDPTRLAQIVSNLLINAAKYTPPGGEISLQAHAENDRVVIRVKDSGTGIPPDMLESVFKMFGQVNRTLDRAQGGLGIGLALARKIVEMHGGRVFAESPGVGQGSTFIVELPRASASTTVSDKPVVNKISNVGNGVKRICVIDDNVDGAASLGMYLEMLGHDVKVFHSGPEALEVIKDTLPEVIFLDIGLPGMTGYEVAKTIRSLPHGNEPFVAAVTGWGTDDDRRKTAEAGCDAHLTKPIDLGEVERILG
jgi:PAS domain S-box-containing protein